VPFSRIRTPALARDWIDFNDRLGFLTRKPIAHHHAEICAGLSKRLQRLGEEPDLILSLFSPDGYALDTRSAARADSP
jgi:hypothetical protein